MEHCADHGLPEILLDTHNRLRRAGTVASQTPVVAADLYWSIGALAQCLTAMDEVISQLGINARKQLRAGKFDVQSGPFEGEPDAALLTAVLALARASSSCEPVQAAIGNAQIAVSDLVVSRPTSA
ncbi:MULTISPECIES: hypothetical protein [Rhodococcus]|uniref:hypothetical protein n=1 Tax=Rhodococcus TaxID=1827 RepID=UPI00080BAA88|nr:hypothetical protein [Rhodococcus sp. JT-3]OCC18490.1 hypothetical protein AS590_09865 [Prescottella equi]WCT03277.1 hypothetical protein PI247_02975 [Rhodococcus qingshengii]